MTARSGRDPASEMPAAELEGTSRRLRERPGIKKVAGNLDEATNHLMTGNTGATYLVLALKSFDE